MQDSTTRLLIVFLLSFLCKGCDRGNDEDAIQKETWQGTQEEFDLQFEQSVNPDLTTTLLNNQTKKEFDGVVERNDSNGLKVQSYKKGKLDGLSTYESTQGSKVEAQFKDGRLNGEMILRDSKGRVRSVITYEDGQVSKEED